MDSKLFDFISSYEASTTGLVAIRINVWLKIVEV